MEICPLSADWGSAADWVTVAVGSVAAFFTYRAVVTANKSSRAAIDEARRMRDEEREHRSESERLRAVARALTFDHELFALGGLIFALVEELDSKEITGGHNKVLQDIYARLPTDPLPMLTRFAGELDAFGTRDAASLLGVLSGWNSISLKYTRDEVEKLHQFEAMQVINSIHDAMRTFLEQLRQARGVTARWVTELRDDLPETDW